MKNNIVVVFSSHLGEDTNNIFKNHIKNTIGCKHEIVCYENNNQYSLASLYNKALDSYTKPNNVIVFVHNDIYFKTKNWGLVLLNRFNNFDYDIIGLAGTVSIGKDGIWWQDKTKLFGIVNHTDGIREWESTFSPQIKGIKDVVCVDGVFIAVNPENLLARFDEDFGLFHFYDLPFCVDNYLEGCNIGVTTDIRIVHKSVGEVNKNWEANRIKFVEKYKDEFPIKLDFEISNVKNLNINIQDQPNVTVIIPTKNNYDVLYENIKSWKDNVKYENYNIIIADTGSDKDTILKYCDLIDLNDKVRVVFYTYYNFAKINNDVVKNYSDDSELVLFCNDDIKLLNDCLSRAVQVYKENPNAGTIGIRLHYADNSVQHNGIYVYSDGENLHITHIDLRKTYFYKDDGYYNSIGNTGAFLMIEKELFNTIGGFNEDYIECFEDVELNFECIYNTRKNYTVCDAVAYHYESMSRDKDENKLTRLREDYFRLLKYYTSKNK